MLCARFDGRDAGPLDDVVGLVADDAETHALLASIGDDERASVRWLQAIREQLEREGA
jgi:hypothetical protein